MTAEYRKRWLARMKTEHRCTACGGELPEDDHRQSCEPCRKRRMVRKQASDAATKPQPRPCPRCKRLLRLKGPICGRCVGALLYKERFRLLSGALPDIVTQRDWEDEL